MKLRANIFLLLLIFSSMLIPVVAKNDKVTVKEATCKPNVQLNVLDAYYGDLDGDGEADDVFARVTIRLNCANRYNFDYLITLTLPSGAITQDYFGINTRLSHLTVETTFINAATEAGDYKIDAEALLATGGQFYTIDTIVFDPPGGTSGTGSVSSKILY